jgi:hypothetical protein
MVGEARRGDKEPPPLRPLRLGVLLDRSARKLNIIPGHLHPHCNAVEEPGGVQSSNALISVSLHLKI